MKSSGKYLFLSDQDDVWELWKVERMYSVMKQNHDCLLLCSDFYPIYEPGAFKVTFRKYKSEKANAGAERLTEFSRLQLSVIRGGNGYCIDRHLVEFYPEYIS